MFLSILQHLVVHLNNGVEVVLQILIFLSYYLVLFLKRVELLLLLQLRIFQVGEWLKGVGFGQFDGLQLFVYFFVQFLFLLT